MSDAPELKVESARKSLWERVSVVWVIPAIALLTALGVAVHSYNERGPLIEITFQNASGVIARQTELRFRDVTVGVAERVSFTEGLNEVLVTVRLDKKVAPYVDESAEFWVVRPRVTTRGVSGLSTVLSGVYIEGNWDGAQGTPLARYTGLESQPLDTDGRGGLRFELRTTRTDGLTDDAPILYRGIEVGRLGVASIAPNGASVTAPAIIYAPHDRLVNSATRFWDVSGVSFSLGASGAELDFASVATLLSGGVTFGTLVSGGTAVRDGVVFQLYPDEAAARNSIFAGSDGIELNLAAVFEDNVSGLTEGAAVELGGVRIGEVSNLTGIVDEERFGDRRVRLLTTLTLRPARLGIEDGEDREEALDFLSERVGAGLRARLTTASLLTGGLKVEMVVDAAAPAAELDRTTTPYPLMPTTKSEISDVSLSAQGVLDRLAALPVEDLLDSAITFLDSATSLVNDGELRRVPGEVTGLLGEMRSVVGSDQIQAVPGQLDTILVDLTASASGLRTLLADLAAAEAVNRLVEALDGAAVAADSVTEATVGVPELVEELQAVAVKAGELPLETLTEEATRLVTSAEALVSSEDTQGLPAALSGALEELAAALAELREGGAVENANQTFASARAAADAVAASAEELPSLIERTEALLDQASRTLAGYDASAPLGRDAQLALRDVQRAAAAVGSLARALERQPNSLLFGR